MDEWDACVNDIPQGILSTYERDFHGPHIRLQVYDLGSCLIRMLVDEKAVSELWYSFHHVKCIGSI